MEPDHIDALFRKYQPMLEEQFAAWQAQQAKKAEAAEKAKDAADKEPDSDPGHASPHKEELRRVPRT